VRVRFALTAYLAVIVASWLPYVALRIYWEYLTRAVPGASHGEFSGPALYFLPRLLIFAAVVTGLAIAGWAIATRCGQGRAGL
jgi:hypothetical protein